MTPPPEKLATEDEIDNDGTVQVDDDERKSRGQPVEISAAFSHPGTSSAPVVNDKSSVDLETGPSEPIYVEWAPDDPENPFNWTRRKKWLITISAGAVTCIGAATGSLIASGNRTMKRDLNASDEQDDLTLSVYALGFGLAPLVLASFSEEWGRRPMYIVFTGIFTLFFLPIALAKNIQTVIIARFIQGVAGSTGATMVGGTVADIWETHERGLPMSSFAFAALVATGLGPVVAGWVEFTLGWRWIEWITMIISGALTIWLAVYGAQETRGPIILLRRAAWLRKETGNPNYRTKFDPPDMKKLIWVSVSRPMRLLLTEPIVASFSLWIGFLWGVLYGLVESIGLVFDALYDFNTGETGLVFLTFGVGSAIGLALNFYQEKLYRENVARRGPEARLYLASVAGFLFPVAAFLYAWTSYSSVHWIAPCIGITLMAVAIFTIYLAVFNYLADAYLMYASSAIAGSSLVRNLSATGFPLFTDQMYNTLNFHWASMLLGLIALVLAPIPLVLIKFGPKIRARSSFAQNLVSTVEVKR